MVAPEGTSLLAVLALAASLAPGAARAASCCGGGGGGAAMLARGDRAMADLSLEWERYDGFWDLDGRHRPDPAGSSLSQVRATLAGGLRLAPSWQVAGALPFAWNRNTYSGLSTRTRGPGDIAISVWFEALDERSAWRMKEAADLVPSVTIGLGLTVPTGVSPYDDVPSSFDVTGRGFYRLDASLLVEKSYRALSLSLSGAYGRHLARPVNRVYGKWVEPYRKRLGDRASAGLSLGYRHFVGTAGHSLTATASLAWLQEAAGILGGSRDPTSSIARTAAGLALSFASTDSDWAARLSWSHAIQRQGWGENFPTTDIFTLGVRRALR
ncbi:MAG: hypothetical protein HZB56_03380 [Deltaproteobacteria bacterium]|nr:hypothetical protein [Deltaproteobacteria bacterium]